MGLLNIYEHETGITRELLDAFNIQPNSTHYNYYADIGLQESWGSDYQDEVHGGEIDAAVELVIDGEIEYLVTTTISDEGKKYLEEHVKYAVLHVSHYIRNTYTLKVEYIFDRSTKDECKIDIGIEIASDFTPHLTYISYDDSNANNKNITMLILKYGE